jgi:hypothetical protein
MKNNIFLIYFYCFSSSNKIIILFISYVFIIHVSHCLNILDCLFCLSLFFLFSHTLFPWHKLLKQSHFSKNHVKLFKPPSLYNVKRNFYESWSNFVRCHTIERTKILNLKNTQKIINHYSWNLVTNSLL